MPFGLNIGNGGEFLPYVKIDGKDGTVSRSTYDGERGTEIIDDFTALFDFATTQIGWLRFTGETPDMRLVPIGDPMPDRPGEDYKQGIKMVVQLAKDLGGPHELATTATGVLGALEKLHDEVLAAPEWEKGQVPVVQLTGWQREKTRKGPRAIPEFAIVGWKDRPEALKKFEAEAKTRVSAPGAARPEKPPTTGSSPLQPPRPEPTPEPATVDLDDFG